MHPWGVRSAMYLFFLGKSANLKYPNERPWMTHNPKKLKKLFQSIEILGGGRFGTLAGPRGSSGSPGSHRQGSPIC